MIRRGKPEASDAIWRWRDGEHEERRRRVSKLRRGALIRAIVGGLIGGALFWLDRPILAATVWTAGTVMFLLAMVSPLGAYAALERGVTILSAIVGRVLTFLALAPVFYLVIAPFGLLFRRGARDPMRRRYEPEAASYWKKRERDRGLERPF